MAKARRGRKRDRMTRRDPDQPSAREHWRADGAPKTAFRDQADANRVALQVRLESGADLDPYRCRICHCWHLGNRPG